MNQSLAHWIALAQGAYFFLTGVWPIVSIETFQMVTGRKTDLWLVKTVGLLVGMIGAVLLWAGWTESVSGQAAAIAVGSSLALTIIDVCYVARKVIAPIYLADALAELMLIGAWAAAVMTR
jgi:hypothetical protein